MARAILGSLFLLGGLSVAGCDLDLEREDGALELSISGISTSVETLTLLVGSPSVGTMQRFDLTPSGASLSHQLTSVPAGVIEVQIDGIVGGMAVQRAQGVASVPADGVGRLNLVMGSGGDDAPVVVASPALTVDLGPLDPNAAGTLSAQGAIKAEAWSAFQALLAGRVEAGESRVFLREARIDVLTAPSDDIEKLQDLWRDAITLSLGQGGQVGAVSLGEDTLSAAFALTTTDVSAVVSVGGGAPVVVISGEAKREMGEDHTGFVRVSLWLEARSEDD